MSVNVFVTLLSLVFIVEIYGASESDAPRRDRRAVTCDSASPYRSLDGSCNNLLNPEWGASGRELQRIEAPVYDDGIGLPRRDKIAGGDLPHPRDISNTVHFQLSFISRSQSNMLMQWGQFLDHTLTKTPQPTEADGSEIECCPRSDSVPSDSSSPCFPIRFATDPFFNADKCINFVRSENVDGTGSTAAAPRQQYNKLSAYIDASQIYGSDEETQTEVRDTGNDGLMKVTNDNMLPMGSSSDCFLDTNDANNYCFKAGDERVNVFAGLQMLQTLFLREHNRVAKELKLQNSAWDDDKLYNEAKRIVTAEMQVITYNEYLPQILGSAGMTTYSLEPSNYAYDNNLDASLSNVFSTAAFRFGHSQVPENFLIKDTVVDTRDMFKRTKYVLDGLNDVIKAFTAGAGERADAWYVDGMRQMMFEEDAAAKDGYDIVALNIQRGRDHGLPPYNAWREHCNLSPVTIFTPVETAEGVLNNDFGNIQARDLRTVYNDDPRDLDLYSAAISERPLIGGAVGPLYTCLIGEQFQKIMNGDRFFYKNTADNTTAFTAAQITELDSVSLARIICDNGDNYDRVQRRVFSLPNAGGNQEQSCTDIRSINFTQWGPNPTVPGGGGGGDGGGGGGGGRGGGGGGRGGGGGGRDGGGGGRRGGGRG